MRNLFKALASVGIAAVALSSCSSTPEEITDMQRPPVTMRITAQETRTSIDGAYKISWAETGETLSVIEVPESGNANAKQTTSYQLQGGVATFEVSFDAKTATSFSYAAVYPQSAYVTSGNYDLTAIKVGVPQIQNPEAASFDPDADVLVSKLITQATQPTSLNLQFARIVALAQMSVANLGIQTGEDVKQVLFTVPNKTISGRGQIDFTTGKVLDQWGYTPIYNYDNVELRYADNAITTAAFDAWFTCIPHTIAAGESFTLKVVTSRGTYTRTVTIPAGRDLAFTTNSVTKFTVDMASAEFEPAVADNSIFTIPFGNATGDTNYTEAYDMGATGTSAGTLTYSFKDPSKVIRATAGNQLYSGGAYWWCTTGSSPLTIGGVKIDNNKYFSLKFDAGAGITKLQASISLDGTNFYPLSKDGVTTTGDKDKEVVHKTMNFTIEGDHTTCYIRLANVGSATCVVDNLNLQVLDAPAADAYLVDWLAVPDLMTDPDDKGTLSFAADDGAGGAPAAQNIDYIWEGGNCSLTVTKDPADTWYTVTDQPETGAPGSGVIVIAPQKYEATDTDRTGTVTVSLVKNGETVVKHTINIVQLQQNGKAWENETFENYIVKTEATYGFSGTFFGTTTGSPEWSYDKCGNPNQANTDRGALINEGVTVTNAKYVAIGKNGSMSVTIPGGIKAIKFNALTSSKGSATISIEANSTIVGSLTIPGNSKKAFEINGIDCQGSDAKITIKQNNQNRTTIGDITWLPAN